MAVPPETTISAHVPASTLKAASDGGRRYRASPREYRITYAALVERDGEFCQVCQEKPPMVKLEVDHTDGKVWTWDLRTLRLLCKTCNVREENLAVRDGRRQILKAATSEGEGDQGDGEGQWSEISYEAQRSREKRPVIRADVYRLLQESGKLRANGTFGRLILRDVITTIAYDTGCSHKMIREVIANEASPVGPLQITSETLVISNSRRHVQILSMSGSAPEFMTDIYAECLVPKGC